MFVAGKDVNVSRELRLKYLFLFTFITILNNVTEVAFVLHSVPPLSVSTFMLLSQLLFLLFLSR